MQNSILIFKYLFFISFVSGFLFCAGVKEDNNIKWLKDEFTFSVINVGQGLSQAGVMRDKAIVWDMGDVHEFSSWLDGYNTIGRPSIKAIAISHSDMDNKGGLSLLPPETDFSGMIIVSPYLDTASLRTFAGEWSESIYFRIVKKGDTLALLDSVCITCIWPPYSEETSQWVNDNYTKNRFSLCFKVTYGLTSVLITSDIDTMAGSRLSDEYEYQLSSDIVVVPHHGSRGSLLPVFYGYINPETAIISCGINNQFGHPAKEIVRLLAFEMSVKLFDTRFNGHVVGKSNGEYWVWD